MVNSQKKKNFAKFFFFGSPEISLHVFRDVTETLTKLEKFNSKLYSFTGLKL